MYIEKTMKLIALSEAKQMLKDNRRVFYYRKEYRPALVEVDLVAGNVYAEVEVGYPNRFQSGSLRVEKNHDGTHTFDVVEDYDVYSAELPEEDTERLVKFLAKSYEEDEEWNMYIW